MKKILCFLIAAVMLLTATSFINIKGDKVMAQGNIYADGVVPLTDENINWSGRWVDLEDGSKQASFESYVEIKFTGTSLSVIINKSWAYVQIDGGEVKSKSFTKNKYSTVVKNLEQGEHIVKIFAVEQTHRPIISGFKIDEGAKTLPINTVKRIEFIGDSIMEGYCTSADKDPVVDKNNSVLNSYGYKTGQMLNKNHNLAFNIVAFGGIAVGKGSTTGNNDWLSMPQRYFKEREFIKETDTSLAKCLQTKDWDTTKYKPDYIVINLGTNDSRTDSTVFKNAYVDFINKLRQSYNYVTIFVMTPFNSTKAQEVREVVSTINNSKVILIDSALWNIPAGSDGLHPAPAAHDTAAEKLFKFLDAYLKLVFNSVTQPPTNAPTTPTPTIAGGTEATPTATGTPMATGTTETSTPSATGTPTATEEPTPQKENNGAVFLWSGIALAAIVGAITTGIVIKRRKQK